MTLRRSRYQTGRGWLALAASMLLASLVQAASPDSIDESLARWTDKFAREVDHRLDVPLVDQQSYVARLQQALAAVGLSELPPQAFLLVDRSAQVQAAFVVLRTPAGGWHWLGATAVSTGKTGTFDHFLTPLGVFPHSLDNADFRALGTLNSNHIRGYGVRGRRVFDFGWQTAERGWGKGGNSQMRLQMHATDPRVLEGRLGRVASEGCIRIPATLNVFLDQHGVLDADYEEAQATGKTQWVLKLGRQTIDQPGRFMVIVDSQATDRPIWALLAGPGTGSLPAPPLRDVGPPPSYAIPAIYLDSPGARRKDFNLPSRPRLL